LGNSKTLILLLEFRPGGACDLLLVVKETLKQCPHPAQIEGAMQVQKPQE
jgi:hypothetical protein